MTVNDDAFNTVTRARRPAYANGMLLDEFDFIAEQDYHRRRLGLALVLFARIWHNCRTGRHV